MTTEVQKESGLMPLYIEIRTHNHNKIQKKENSGVCKYLFVIPCP